MGRSRRTLRGERIGEEGELRGCRRALHGLLLAAPSNGRVAGHVAGAAIPVERRSPLRLAGIETLRNDARALLEHAAPTGLRVRLLCGAPRTVGVPDPRRNAEQDEENGEEEECPAADHGCDCSITIKGGAIAQNSHAPAATYAKHSSEWRLNGMVIPRPVASHSPIRSTGQSGSPGMRLRQQSPVSRICLHVSAQEVLVNGGTKNVVTKRGSSLFV